MIELIRALLVVTVVCETVAIILAIGILIYIFKNMRRAKCFV